MLLGHVISKSCVRPEPQKTTGITAFSLPADKKAICRFLGLGALYRWFVENFAQNTEPLTNLARSSFEFKSESQQEEES